MTRQQPSHDRVRLTSRQQLTWITFILKSSDLRCDLTAAWTDEIAAIEADIDRLGRRLREHLGLEGGDT